MLNIEYEKKKLLTKNEYDELFHKLSKIVLGKSFIQINYYYDTDSLCFSKRNETVRIRMRDEKLTFEYKLHKQQINNTKVSKEIIESTKFFPKTISINNIKLSLIGNMTTYRTNFQLDNALVSLDVNYYLGKIDYEIEVEADNENSILHSAIHIFDEIPTSGKYTRFISALRSMDDIPNFIYNEEN